MSLSNSIKGPQNKIITRRKTSKHFFLKGILLVLFLFFSVRGSYADEFQEIKGGSYSIYYEDDVKIDTLYIKLRKRRIPISDSVSMRSLGSTEEKIIHRIDLILRRVRETLDMYPAGVTFTIKVFKNRESVYDAYAKITGKRSEEKSFYHHKSKTIYISERDMSDSIIAHELAHVIIDNYFIVRPPSKVSELMAIHVDTHLDK